MKCGPAARGKALVQSVARDYYGLLGVAKDGLRRRDQAGLPQARPRAAPRRQPGPGKAQQQFKEVTAAYEVLSDPAKRQVVDLGGDPLSPGGGGNGAGGMGDPFGGMGLGDIMDAFFGGGAAPGPAVRGPGYARVTMPSSRSS